MRRSVLGISWSSAFVLYGCADDSASPHREPPPAHVSALRVAGEDCAELDEALFVQGSQLGYHTELGVLVEATSGEIALGVQVTDAETGERVAGTRQDVFIALVGWSEDDPVGWASTAAVVNEGFGGDEDLASVCALSGRPLVVESCASLIGSPDRSCTTASLPGRFEDLDLACPAG